MKKRLLQKTIIMVSLILMFFISCKKEQEPKYVEKDTIYFYRLAAINPDSVVDYSEIAHITTLEIVEVLSDGREDEKKEKEEPKLLPLKLEYFKVGIQNGKIVIGWKHTDESDVVKYLIEKSKDGKQWSQVYTQIPTHRLPYEYIVEDNFRIK